MEYLLICNMQGILTLYTPVKYSEIYLDLDYEINRSFTEIKLMSSNLLVV